MVLTSRAVADYAFAQSLSPCSETGGYIQYREIGNYVIVDRLHWCNSHGTGAFRSVTKEQTGEFYSKMWDEYGVGPNNLSGIWHTHPDFSTFWSATDVKEGIQDVLLYPGSTLYSLVISTVGDAKGRYDVRTGDSSVESESLHVKWNIPMLYKSIYFEHETLKTSPTYKQPSASDNNRLGPYGINVSTYSSENGVGRASYGYQSSLDDWEKEYPHYFLDSPL